MSDKRQRNIELLARKNEAKREHPYYLTELSRVLNQPVTENDLVDLVLTDELLSQYNEAARRNERTWCAKANWPFEPQSRWLRVCFCIAKQLQSDSVALFAGPYSACGAIRTKGAHPLVNAPSVLAFDRDTVRMQSLNSNGGLYLDLYEENSLQFIELKIWGDWYSRAKQCLS